MPGVGSARAWCDDAVRLIEADACRSADTHLLRYPLAESWAGPNAERGGIQLYLKDESTHITGSLKHRLARSLFLHALCNGWVGPETTIIEASSGSTAVSEAYFARMLDLPFVAVVPRGTSALKVALIEAEGGRHADLCPFCATPVVTDTGTARRIKPQGVLPFVVTEDQARAALEDWLKGLWFAPSGLTRYARRGRRLSGVYSPFWTFDADSRSTYRGMRGDAYYETVYVTQEVNGRMQQVPQQVRRIRWTPVAGQVARNFDDVLVLASSSLPRSFTDALTPWDLSHLTDYRPEYLSGFEAEGYTIPLADGHGVARQEMAGVIAMDVRRDIGGDEQQIGAIDSAFSAETFKHILLPIWSAAYKYNGKSYRFVVNGQSGRVHGERPYSAWKIAAAVILTAALIALALWLGERSGVIDLGGATSFNVPATIDGPGGYILPDPGGTILPLPSSGGYIIRGY